MAFNIGTPAVEAIKELRGNQAFDDLMAALGVITQTRMLAAMNTDPAMRTDATAHARGVYELWASIHAAHAGVHPGQVRPPPMPLLDQLTQPAKPRERING